MSPATFRDATFAAERHAEWKLKADGSVTLKQVSAAAAWLRWPLRAEAERLTYDPGRPALLPRADGAEVVTNGRDESFPLYNVWSGWGTKPRRGNVGPFLQLVDHLFKGADRVARSWFLDWLAYPLVYPGTKLFTSAVVFGVRHGTGKSLLGYTMGRIYGSNFTEITAGDLHSSFNDWAEGRQFVLADDVLGSNQRRDADTLKRMITQKELRINRKFVPTYVVPDRVNYYFTSNHPDAFFLEDDDRRFFIHEVVVDPLPEVFYVDYDLWLASEVGPAALFDYLLRRDVSGFNPAAPAPRTTAKARMIADARSDLGAWVERLRLEPEGVLRLGERPLPGDLYSSRELLALYDPTNSSRATANGVGRELKRQGFRQVARGRPVRSKRGLERYFALRNAERWLAATPAALRRHLEATMTPESKEKF
jgi:hypothetical protein